MNIVICGSMSASKEIVEVARELEMRGYSVVLPDGVEEYAQTGCVKNTSEATEKKIAGDLIRGHYERMKDCDAVLVVNPPKKGIDGYIGANSFLELGFGHVLHKDCYVLYDYDHTSPYASEIEAMQPVVLRGDTGKIIRLCR